MNRYLTVLLLLLSVICNIQVTKSDWLETTCRPTKSFIYKQFDHLLYLLTEAYYPVNCLKYSFERDISSIANYHDFETIVDHIFNTTDKIANNATENIKELEKCYTSLHSLVIEFLLTEEIIIKNCLENTNNLLNTLQLKIETLYDEELNVTKYISKQKEECGKETDFDNLLNCLEDSVKKSTTQTNLIISEYHFIPKNYKQAIIENLNSALTCVKNISSFDEKVDVIINNFQECVNKVTHPKSV